MNLPVNEVELEREVKRFRYLYDRRDPMRRVDSIKAYLKLWNIDKVVVGISGGVDSALVLALLAQIPDITIYAETITFDQYNNVFSKNYVEMLKQAFRDKDNIVWNSMDGEGPFQEFMHEFCAGQVSPEVDANVSYAMRYLAFFARAQAVGGITVGTTNLDEMGYVGWFGKNSDMMVDLQPISDLHKFEVREWAEYLDVPKEIINRTPTGDLIDNSSDEENFGCTYDELSWFTMLMANQKRLNEFLTHRFAKVIALRKKNDHKYQGQKFNPVFLRG